ncbi:hypothetical protein [Microcoleus sp. bin38.metabat.b11b12b14.051]|uniref:hypothetical protein n=1 Tax=Microcoleus sp. bin38.metabat.b11b12b14.051 TaxID=2742709 RepID=UPI0025F91A9C|nr:hypothetical protein [Microcoleus sp. bin38.metabat.b11b12b14.051]
MSIGCRIAIEKNLQLALRKLLEFRHGRATVKNLDIPGTIPARSLQPYPRSYAPTPLSWISATRHCHNPIELHQQQFASLQIVLKRTNILDELERKPVIHRYLKYLYI